MTNPIILFDGVCNLCNSVVNFMITRDRQAVFRFGPLQSPTAKKILEPLGLATNNFSTLILVENARAYTESTAALKILRALGGVGTYLYFFILIPKPIRDRLYRIIARNRYRWFGRTEQCRLPTPDIQERFLDWDEQPHS